jgi:hypothetical protein
MKDFLRNGALILLVIAVLYIIFLRECKKPEPCPPVGQVLVSQKTWDSIQIIANMPPVTIIDTFYLKGDTVWVSSPLPVPVPDPEDSTINNYSDSLVNENINVWIDFRLRGTLLDRNWHYIPIITEITKETINYVPKIVDREVPVPKDGYYLSGILGGRAAMPIMYGASLDLVTKKGNLYGMQFQRMGTQNFYSFRLGAKIRLK